MPNKEACRPNGQPAVLRWFCGVPVFVNPLILVDLFSAAILLWFGTLLSMVVAQKFFGGVLHGDHLRAASIFASYLVFALLGLFIGVCMLFYRQGYVVLYRLERSGVFSETMKISSRSSGSLLNHLPFPVVGELNPKRSVTKEIEWDNVAEVKPVEKLRVVLLKGRWSVLMRVYCPDEKTFKDALTFSKGQVNLHGKSRKN